MGLTTWKNAPDGRILKSDVGVAKNYLEEKQIRQLERAVSRQEALKKAETEYAAFNKTQKIISDFDKELKKCWKQAVGSNSYFSK